LTKEKFRILGLDRSIPDPVVVEVGRGEVRKEEEEEEEEGLIKRS